MGEIIEKTWIDLMVERESVPKVRREENVPDFCQKHGITPQAYYYQKSKEENKKRILEITLNIAKDEAPEVLEKLVEKAKEGDMKAMAIYVDSILKLAKELDLKIDAKNIKDLLLDTYAQRQGQNTGTV